MEFENLLNKKCSWSYRFENTEKSIGDNEQFLLTETIPHTVQINGNQNDRVIVKKSKDSFVETGTENRDKLLKNVQNEKNALPMKTYGRIIEVMKKKCQTKSNKSSASDSKKNSLMDESNLSSASSTEDEILQTRFSVMNKHTFKSDEYDSNDCDLSLSKDISYEEKYLENSLNRTKSPIIIHICNGKNTARNGEKDVTQKQGEITKRKEINSENTDRDSLSIDGIYFNTDMENKNSIPISNENCNEQSNVKNYLTTENGHGKLLQQIMGNITTIAEHDLTDRNLLKSKISNDTLENEFLNGSFDINTYKLQNFKDSKFPSTKMAENNEFMKTNQIENKNNRHYKRKLNELNRKNKRVKHNSHNNKTKLSKDFSSKFTIELKHNKLGTDKIKSIPKPKTAVEKKRNRKLTHKKVDNVQELDLNICPKTTKNKNLLNNKKIHSEELDMNFQDITNNTSKNKQTKQNSLQQKYKFTLDVFDGRSPPKYSGRKTRNSSLIASKKIKEIEKLENVSSSDQEKDVIEEITIDSDNILDYEETTYNLLNTDNFRSGNVNTNRIKTKYKYDKNIPNLQVECMSKESNSDKVHDSIQSGKHRKQDSGNALEDPFVTPSKSKFSSGKKGMKENNSENQTFDIDLFDCYFKNERDYSSGNEERSKEVNRKDNYKAKNFFSNNYYTENKNKREKGVSFNSHEKTAAENKHKTWDSLEKEILEDLDDNDSVCKTIFLQEEAVLSKKELVKDTNLLTVSNRSLKKTISKSKKGKYNMKYEIKNTESKFLETKGDNTFNFRNGMNIQQSKETVSEDSKNASILDKAIMAMDKCVVMSITPQTRLYDSEGSVESWQFEDFPIIPDIPHKTQFHSSTTLMANDKEQYYSMKTYGYLRKSKKNDDGSIKFKQKCDMHKRLDDFDQLIDNENEIYINTKHPEASPILSKNNLFINYPEKSSYKESRELVPYFKGTNPNPWDQLIEKLEGTYSVSDSKTKESKKQRKESLENAKDSKRSSSNLKGYKKMHVPFDDNEIKLSQSEHEFSKKEQKNKVEKLVNYVAATDKQSFIQDNLNSHDIQHRRDSKEIEKRSRKLTKAEKNIKHQASGKQTNAVKSQRYKLKFGTDGAFKLRKQSSTNSSITDDSNDCSKISKKIESVKAKDNKSFNTSKTRERYKKHLRKAFDKQDSLQKKDQTDEKTKPKELEDEVLKNLDQCPNNSNIRKIKLIAENDDDIFSLSSSDSEGSIDKIPGTGLLCDIFEE